MIFQSRRLLVAFAVEAIDGLSRSILGAVASETVFRSLHDDAEKLLLDGSFGDELLNILSGLLSDNIAVERFLAGLSSLGSLSPLDEVQEEFLIAVFNLLVSVSVQALGQRTFLNVDEAEKVRGQIVNLLDVARNQFNLSEESNDLISDLLSGVITYFSNLASVLPRLVTYSYHEQMPSLVIATRFYGDGERGDEIFDMANEADHPLFMPYEGRVLSR